MSREQELAVIVVECLQAEGWDVYQEVQPYAQGAVCDIVAVRGPITWAIEVKASFGLAVLDQGARWLHYANLVSVATPPSKARHGEFVHRTMGHLGMGWLVINDVLRTTDTTTTGRGSVRETIRPRLTRTVLPRLRESLRDEHKTWASAGSTGSQHFTRFKRTCMDVEDWVKRNPGGDLGQMIEGIKHHYANDASARGSLRTWIEAGKLPGVEARREGRRILLYPTEAA